MAFQFPFELDTFQKQVETFSPLPFRNRLISDGLKPILSYIEKLRLASYYIQFFTNIKTGLILKLYSNILCPRKSVNTMLEISIICHLCELLMSNS